MKDDIKSLIKEIKNNWATKHLVADSDSRLILIAGVELN